MNVRKTAAALYCVVVLSIQIWVGVPWLGGPKAWYWPFVSYPMYARSFESGEGITHRTLRAHPCGNGESDRVDTLGHRRLDISRYRLRPLLRRAAEGEVRPLRMLVGERSPSYCRIEVLEHTLTVDRDGLEMPLPSPVVVRRFPLPRSGVADTSPPGLSRR